MPQAASTATPAGPRCTFRSDPRQPWLLDWRPLSPDRPPRPREPWDGMSSEEIYRASPWLTPFALMTDRILMVEADPETRLWASVLRTSWLNATWADTREGQPLTGIPDRDKERLDRRGAREDAMDFWAGVVDPGDCQDVGWGEAEELLTLDLIAGQLLGWPVARLRAEAHRRLRERSPTHAGMLADALRRARSDPRPPASDRGRPA